MRIRRKKWARPELAVCPYYIGDAPPLRGKWHGVFPDPDKPLYVELGCGKGIFAARSALCHPEINWLALDIKSEMLAVGRRNIEKLFAENRKAVDNLRLVSCNISHICESFSKDDTADRIFINFCNPWSRSKHNKRRLTHPRQLIQYRTFLKDGGEIRFKTDDDGLFEDSVKYFEECAFGISYITRDFHNSGYAENFVTEHEKMFSDEGKKIKFLIAVKNDGLSPVTAEKYKYVSKDGGNCDE